MTRSLPTILVTGGLGFLGKSLAIKLLKLGYKVVILDFRSATPEEKKTLAGAKLIVGDVTDPSVWIKLPIVDVIYHFAAPASVVLFKTDLGLAVRITLQGLTNAFNWADHHQIKRLIYPSSGSIFGGASTACDETTLPDPPNVYGLTKLACEAIAKIYAGAVPSLGLRIFAGYGPQEAQKGEIASVVTLFLTSLMAGQKPVIYGDGSQTRDFVYIDDVVDTMVVCLNNDLTGVLNVGSGQSLSFNQVIAELNRLLKTQIQPEYIARPPSYLDSTLCQSKKMVKLLGRKPLSFKQGIRQYLKQLPNLNQI